MDVRLVQPPGYRTPGPLGSPGRREHPSQVRGGSESAPCSTPPQPPFRPSLRLIYSSTPLRPMPPQASAPRSLPSPPQPPFYTFRPGPTKAPFPPLLLPPPHTALCPMLPPPHTPFRPTGSLRLARTSAPARSDTHTAAHTASGTHTLCTTHRHTRTQSR